MKLKRIIIDFIPIEKMRWNGLGDYYEMDGNGVKQIFVADTGNELYNRLIAQHELTEDTLLVAHSISVKTIDDYCDKVFAEGGEPDSCNPESPIHREHCFADSIERLTAIECGISQKKYDDDIEEYIRKELP